MNTYGATKAAADLALGAMANEGLRILRARPFNHTGPGQSAAFVVAAFARQIARVAAGLQPPVLQVGALEPMRDFLDVRDVCACYAQCLAQAGRGAGGDGPEHRVRHAAPPGRRAGRDAGHRRGARGGGVGRRPVAPVGHPAAVGDAALAHRLLGWAPVIPWRQTLSDMLDDWRQRVRAEPA